LVQIIKLLDAKAPCGDNVVKAPARSIKKKIVIHATVMIYADSII